MEEIVLNWYSFFFTCFVEFTVKPAGPEIFFVGRFSLKLNFLDIGLFGLSISSKALVVCLFQGICPLFLCGKM